MLNVPEISSGSLGRFRDFPQEIHVYDFPRWKWPVIRQCFPGLKVHFLRSGSSIPVSACLVLWGMAPLPPGAGNDVRVLRVEDGFMRSVGLGAELVRPMSWVVDSQGIYYDATRPSDLEEILSTLRFDEAQQARAARLRAQILSAGLTKYNVGSRSWVRPSDSGRVILVPGQVESDASLAYGAPGVRTNLGLLQAVRSANPDAYLIYKPHPDVAARLRREGEGERDACNWCDEVVVDVPMDALLSGVDEVHVMTSLAGFEALLRGKSVTCYGQPFYSGWGLTNDLLSNARRVRRLALDELVAGALIIYPLYLRRDGMGLIEVEGAVAELASWRQRKGSKEAWWKGIYRIFLRLFIGVR